MNYERARRRLVLRVQPATEPVLTDDELDDCLSYAATIDVDGRPPSDPEWTPTYAQGLIDEAAARAWEAKAGKAAAEVYVMGDGVATSGNMVYDHCMAMATACRKRVRGSMGLRPAGSS